MAEVAAASGRSNARPPRVNLVHLQSRPEPPEPLSCCASKNNKNAIRNVAADSRSLSLSCLTALVQNIPAFVIIATY